MINLPGAFASIANRISSTFGAPFFDGFILVPGLGGGIGSDGMFHPGGNGSQVACRVQIDDASETMKASEGFADGDVVMIILASGLGIALTTDMQVVIPAGPRAGNWLISQIGQDPASIGYSAKGRWGSSVQVAPPVPPSSSGMSLALSQASAVTYYPFLVAA